MSKAMVNVSDRDAMFAWADAKLMDLALRLLGSWYQPMTVWYTARFLK